METMAVIFQSLADVTRMRILALLLQETELCVCDIMAVLQLPQSTVSRHLAILKGSGWLHDRREGVWIYYSITHRLAPLNQSLLPILRHFLHDEASAKADMERLRDFGSRSNCA